MRAEPGQHATARVVRTQYCVSTTAVLRQYRGSTRVLLDGCVQSRGSTQQPGCCCHWRGNRRAGEAEQGVDIIFGMDLNLVPGGNGSTGGSGDGIDSTTAAPAPAAAGGAPCAWRAGGNGGVQDAVEPAARGCGAPPDDGVEEELDHGCGAGPPAHICSNLAVVSAHLPVPIPGQPASRVQGGRARGGKVGDVGDG